MEGIIIIEKGVSSTGKRHGQNTTMTNFSRLLICICLAIAGCASLTHPPYGHVAADRLPFSSKSKKATLPDGAASISQGYKPDTRSTGLAASVRSKSDGIHEGIDILHSSGTPVLAAADGVVESSRFGPLFGNQIVVDHGQHDDGLYFKTKYFHLQHRHVNEGESVSRGQQIGTLGMTGLLSGGFAHLHFEIRVEEEPSKRLTKPVHPHKYWADGVGVVTCFDIERSYPEAPFRTTYPVPCAGTRWKAWERNHQ